MTAAVSSDGLTKDYGGGHGVEPYRRFSPFFHYIGDEPLRHGLGADHVAVLLGATAGLAVLAVLTFARRDVAA